MPFRRPTDTNLEVWYAAAWRIDQAQLANKAFQSMLWMTTLVLSYSAPSQSTPLLMFCPPQLALPPVPPRLPLSTPSGEIPMDVDTVWKTHSLPLRRCYQCEEANHLVKDCLHYLDVQRLTVEQREELIEDLMALKDAVEEEEVCSTPEEDFA